MKAIVQSNYGSPDVFELKETDKPVVWDNDVLICVHAAALNAGDVSSMRGSPWVARFAVGFPKPMEASIRAWRRSLSERERISL